MVPDQQVLGTGLVGIEIILGGIESVDLKGGFPGAGVDQFRGEIYDVVVVGSKLLHELVVAEESGIGC